MHHQRLVHLDNSQSSQVDVSRYVVFDFGSAVFDMAEYNMDDFNKKKTSSEFDLNSTEKYGSDCVEFDMNIGPSENYVTESDKIDQTSVEPIIETLNPINLPEDIASFVTNESNTPLVIPSILPLPEESSVLISGDTPLIITPSTTSQSTSCPPSSSLDNEDNNITESMSDSELMMSHIPIAALFFMVGVISAYMAGYVRKEVNKFLLKRQRWYLDNLEKRVITLLNGAEFEKAARLLKRELPTVIQYRGADHVDTAAFQHFLAKCYIGLQDGVSAERCLEEVKRIYDPFGEDAHMAHVLEDWGMALKLQNKLEESKIKMFMALRIFTEEALIEESASVITTSTFSSSLSSFASSPQQPMGSDGVMVDGFSNYHSIESYMQNDYHSKKRETQSKFRRSADTNHDDVFSPVSTTPFFRHDDSYNSHWKHPSQHHSDVDDEYRVSNAYPSYSIDDVDVDPVDLNDIHCSNHSNDDSHRNVKRKYHIDSEVDFLNAVGDLEQLLQRDVYTIHSGHSSSTDSISGPQPNGSTNDSTANRRPTDLGSISMKDFGLISIDDEEERRRKLLKTNKDVARVERSIAGILDESGELEKAKVYYKHSQLIYSELKDDDSSTAVGDIQCSINSICSRLQSHDTKRNNHLRHNTDYKENSYNTLNVNHSRGLQSMQNNAVVDVDAAKRKEGSPNSVVFTEF
eukprot:CAMPEP_0170074602 /NCGR_PEP_ID=MMETSP0019_2-20121128/11877_1 /TAXON_ID=98059 /ORGANISM="Dinobryon sp., Strain UTEXLB2267" /LENGTH=688 /DNA_ID=CAMNT_0010285011 /DNA_START=352 /DNA_END=2418 /DNA_ORIENTATION=-